MDWRGVAVPLGGSFSPRVWLGMQPIFPTNSVHVTGDW